MASGGNVTTISASEARARLYGLLDEAAESGEPIQITGRRNNAVLVSEQDWRAIQETLYLLSIPGMRESIRKGLKTPVKKCSTDPGW
jgi:prevent-host-death family protein